MRWDVLQYVSGAVSLLGFTALCLLKLYELQFSKRQREIEDLSGTERSELVRALLGPERAEDLTAQQRYRLAIKELQARRAQTRAIFSFAILALVVSLASFAFATVFTHSRITSGVGADGPLTHFEVRLRYEQPVEVIQGRLRVTVRRPSGAQSVDVILASLDSPGHATQEFGPARVSDEFTYDGGGHYTIKVKEVRETWVSLIITARGSAK